MTNTNPAPQSPKNEKASAVLKALWNMLINHWGYKLLALLLAIALWAGLITQDPTLTREKTFSDAVITVNGTDTVKRNGFIVTSDMTKYITGVTMRVEVPQGQYQNAQYSNYNPRVDLSRITYAGEQELRVLTTTSTTYGSVIDISPTAIPVTVEEYVTRYRIPVSVVTTGALPEGWYASNASIDPPNIAVSGPKSLVDQVRRAEVTVDLSTLPAREGVARNAFAFSLVDARGETVQGQLLETTIEGVLLDSINVEQTLSPKRDMDVGQIGLVVGTPGAGYEIKDVKITPSRISVAGSADAIAELENLYAEATVDASGKTESFVRQVRVHRPTELKYMSSESINVAVSIGPIIMDKDFPGIRVKTRGLASGLSAEINPRSVTVSVRAPQLWMDKLRSNDLAVVCDLTALEAGEYDLPLVCEFVDEVDPEMSCSLTPDTVHVTIR